MTARMARITLSPSSSNLHQHRGPAWKPAPLLPEGEAHTDPAGPPAGAPPVPAPPAGAAQPTVSGVPSPPPAAPAAPAAPAKPGDGLPDDPAALKAEILKLREENGKDRTAAKTKAAEDAAKAARDEVAQTIGKALGLIKDNEQLDPAELAKKAADATSAAAEAQVQLAVFKAAAGKADPVKLLDRNSFTSKLKGLDPSVKDFDTKVAAAIDEAVKNDPTLKATGQAPGASAVPAAGGSGENGRVRATSLGAAIEAQRLASTTT